MTPFLGQLAMISWNFPPKGWAFCNGQLLPINQNQALFSILGTTYGGDGRVNFALPDLRGRTPFHVGQGLVLGQRGGEENHTLTLSELAAHTHLAVGSSSVPNAGSPLGNTWATPVANAYAAAADSAMHPGAIGNAGGSQPHPNMPPFLVIHFVIALQGIFPSRN